MENAVRRPEDVRIERLGNGLTVILQTLSYSPVAAVNITYRIGSLWESEGTRGFSHLCEHMMFKGSRDFPPGEYWRVVQMNGGLANAYTSRDITVYYSVLPRAGLGDILHLEADRMQRCEMRDEHVLSETSVILEEELLTQRDDPEGSLDALLYSTAFGTHPYGRPITGTAEDIRSFSPDRLRKFYGNFYRPGNAILSIVGDVETGDVMEQIRDLFGEGLDVPVERPTIQPEPLQTRQLRARLEHPSRLPAVTVGFRVPEGNHPDSSPLSLISLYLSSGRSSRFEELLVRPSTVLDVSVSTNTHIMPGLFVARAVLPEGGSPAAVETVIMKEMERLASEGIDRDTLEALKRRRTAWSMISDADPPGRSRRFSTGRAKFEDTFYYWNSIESMLSVTCEDIMRTASSYLGKGNSTVAVLDPVSSSASLMSVRVHDSAEPAPDIKPPSIQPPWELEIPDRLIRPPECSVADGSRELELKNGLRVILRRDESFPIVSVGFSCPMGSSMEPRNLRGLAQMTVETMLYGTPEQDSIEFNARTENLGASLDFSAADEYSGGVITALAGDLGEILEVVSELLRRPAFRQEDMEAVRRDAISGLEEWLSTPVGAAMNSFSRHSTEPKEMSSVPTRETLGSITRDDMLAFHGNYCRPKGSVLTVVGNFSDEGIEESIASCFASWSNPEEDPPPVLEIRNSDESSENGIQLPGREQIAIVLGCPAPPRKHSDSYAISILSRILGEGIGSRLGREIRETGLSYHVSSMYIPLKQRGRVAALVLTSPDAFSEVLERLVAEMDRLSSEKVSRSELRLEKASYMGLQELGMMKYPSIARILLTYASLGFPLDHDRSTMASICALDEERIQEAAAKWFGRRVTWLSYAGGMKGSDVTSGHLQKNSGQIK